jgi:ketosteroid isomerase-like protein
MLKLMRIGILLPLLVLVLMLVAALLLGCDGCGRDRVPSDRDPVGKNAEPDDGRPGDPVETFLIGLRAYNEANLEDLLAAYADDATWYMPCSRNPLVRGRKAVARQIVAFKGLMPESSIGVRRLLTSGDWLVAQAVLHGTHRWNAQGIERPPRKVGYEMISFVRADKSGKASETLVYYDQTALRRQLGAIEGVAPPVPKWPSKPERITAAGDDANVERVRQVFDLVEKGRFDELDAVTTDGFTLYDRASGKRYSLAELKAQLQKERQTLVDPQFELLQTISAGNVVALRFMERARLKGVGADRENGSPVEFHGAYVFEIKDGKIAVAESYTNTMELRLQLKEITAAAKDAQPAPDAGPSEP